MDPCIICGCETDLRNDFDEPVCEDCQPEEGEDIDIDDEEFIEMILDDVTIDTDLDYDFAD